MRSTAAASTTATSSASAAATATTTTTATATATTTTAALLVSRSYRLSMVGRTTTRSSRTRFRWLPRSSRSLFGGATHEVANVAEDKAVGINTYVWVADQSAHAEHSERRPACDYQLRVEHGCGDGRVAGTTRQICRWVSRTASRNNSVKASAAGRWTFYYSNYGKGVIFWGTDTQAACWVNYDDVNSADIYWFTDGNVCSSSSRPALLRARGCQGADSG